MGSLKEIVMLGVEDMKVIYSWYCRCCGGDFYTDWEEEPEFCPYCRETELEHKKDFEIKELKR